MHLKDILKTKGSAVHTIGPEASLNDVVAKLVEHNCGSLVVCAEQSMVGIITERDILRACHRHDQTLDTLRVADCMTRDVVTGTPNDKVNDVMSLMTTRRIRHLPVLDNHALSGVISIGDIVKAQSDQLAVENQYLKNYIQS